MSDQSQLSPEYAQRLQDTYGQAFERRAELVDIRQDLQKLQDEVRAFGESFAIVAEEPAQCPACWQPVSKVYCTPVLDVEVRLQLRAAGRSEYAGPCHRVNIPLG
jgi:hypothetical protein